MAKKRMISNEIVDSDLFLEMPQSSQLLYFHLNIRADDDGFINRPNAIMKICGSGIDDMKILISKKFIIPFETGIVVIKHWRVHNYIQKDRYTETTYKDEKSTLALDENNVYIQKPVIATDTERVHSLDTVCIQSVSPGKVRLDKISKDKISNTVVVADAKHEKKDKNKYKRIEIIQYLNMRTNSKYRPNSKEVTKLINGRIADGFKVQDFKDVIDKKCIEWSGTEMSKFLRPSTLFATSHFEEYLNQQVEKKKTGNPFADMLNTSENTSKLSLE